MFGLCVVAGVAFAGCDALSGKSKEADKVSQVKVVNDVPEAPKASAGVTATAADGKLDKGLLARVGSWTITPEEFSDRLNAVKQVVKDFDDTSLQAKQLVLEELIRQQLLVYEARQQKLEQGKDVQAAVRDFENSLIVQELAVRLTKDIKATEADAREYYDANPDVFVTPVEKKVRQVVVPTQSEAKDILVLALQGQDFAQLAKDKSRAKNAAEGGDLGFLVAAPFEQMQKALETMKKNDVSAVFEGPEGFYLVKVEDVRGGEKQSFDTVKEDLVKGLTLQLQQQAVLGKMSETAARIKVQVNNDLLK
jgi:peptidyl-prolyl cis-trans isomerase C